MASTSPARAGLGSGNGIGGITHGTMYVKEGALTAPWVAEMGGATAVSLAA